MTQNPNKSVWLGVDGFEFYILFSRRVDRGFPDIENWLSKFKSIRPEPLNSVLLNGLKRHIRL